MKKRALILCLIPLFALTACPKTGNNDLDNDGIINKIDNNPEDNTKLFQFSGNMFGDASMTSSTISFKMDYSLFTEKKFSTYNKDLVTLGLMLSGDIYPAEVATVTNGIYENKDKTDDTIIYQELGFKKAYIQDLSSNTYSNDANDTIRFAYASQNFTVNGTSLPVCFITFQGTNGNNEWSSNLDIGYNNTAYTTLSGTHTEWTNKENHKGFDVAANRVIDFLNKAIASGSIRANTFFVTGHSRGAAIANLVAKALIDTYENYSVCAYTFASPLTTCATDTTKYTTIHNIVNSDDTITTVPSSRWGFKRFGTDHVLSVKNDALDKWNLINPDSTYKTQDSLNVDDVLYGLAATREAIYTLDQGHQLGDEAMSLEDFNDTKEEIFGLWPEMEKYIVFDEPKFVSEDNYEITYKVYPAFVQLLVSDLLSKSSQLEMFASILGFSTFFGDYLSPILPSLLSLDTDGFAYPHIPSTYAAII